MITSNIVKPEMNVSSDSGGFYLVSDSLRSYAEMVKNLFNDENGQGGNDHFISTRSSISEVWTLFQSKGLSDAGVLQKLTQKEALKSWFSVIVCMILFGLHDKHHLTVVGINGEGREYINVWRNKFFSDGVNDNALPGEKDHNDVLNIYEFIPGDVSTMAGCYSRQFFVIPPKYILEYEDGNASEWQLFYHQMMKSFPNIDRFLETHTTVLQKCLLLLSAGSMPDNRPIAMVKEYLLEHIHVPMRLQDVDLKGVTLGETDFFSGKSEYYSEDVLRCEACMFCYKDLEYILYPFQKRFRDHIENGKCTIDELKMTAEQTYDPQTHTNRPEKLIVSGFANYPIFIIGADEKQIQLTYRFSFQREYDSSSISYLNTIPSFSMYPDVALEQEHLCRKFIYFTNSSCIQSSTENSSERNVILNQPECFGDLFDRNTDIAMHISREQYRFSVKEHCCHLLPVFEKDHCLGYVLNLRTKVTDYPPLLRRGGIPLQLELTPVNRGEDNGVMHIYVDYGSRSSAIAYRVGTTGQLQTKVITRNGRMVRQLLGVYAPERYHNFLDFDPLIRSVESIPSCIPENDLTDSSEILPFHRLLLSYRLHESEQEGMHLRYHRKNSSLRCRIPDNAQMPYQRHDNRGRGGNDDIGYVTLYSLCYLAVLYAVSLNCSDVILYPVVSADHDVHKLISSMNQITEALQSFFALRIKHPMESPDSFMLRESLLVSNPVQAVPNVMTISVYIGDDRTEMTAVRYLDQNHRRVCAESSLPYGGRDLLYGVLYDALGNCISQKEAESFLLGIDGKLSFLSWKPEHEVLVRELVKSICKKFYANSDRIGKPRDDSWQACFDELLRYASIRIGTPDNPQDIKAKADLLIRCGILMPVICDFLDVAAANCEEPPTTVQLCFYGGAAEIIRLADAMTGSAEDGFLKTAERYLNQGRTYPCYISLSDSNSKSQVLNGMSLICTASGNDTEKLIMQNGVIFPLSQDMTPKISIVIPGSLRETVLKQFGFRSIDNQADIANNLEIRKNPKNFLPADLWDDTDTHSFKVYLSALRETFLRQKDVYDFTKTSFITEATFLTRKSNSDFLLSDHAEVSTFLPASEAEIYPEMLRNAAYLFETIRLLSEKYGNGFHEKYSGKDHSTYHFFC